MSHIRPASHTPPRPFQRNIGWTTVRTSLEDALHDLDAQPDRVCRASRAAIREALVALIERVQHEEDGR